ncbi:MAG: NAD-dependent aldehyde dehydrogenase [Bacteroidetes bacterium]|jgi:hypothetical protein|nr:NAD-dependent aldehyde dehydrogenase [Bacteroidota bacterium]
MILKQRIETFVKVGLFINRHFAEPDPSEVQLHQGLNKVTELAYIHNGWFSLNFVNHAIASFGRMLNRADLEAFATKEVKEPKTVAVICAGNIPMVGFHDIMCVLLSGNKAMIKLSSDDDVLLPFFLKLITFYEPEFENYILFAADKMTAFDAVIATGSNNTSRYFEHYFGKYPNIIRKNRTSVAILSGHETETDLKNLGADIFTYYGLGCRNVSKVLVPENYNFNAFFEAIVDYGFVIDNKKYGNNYDYHRAIYLLEQHKFLDNNFLMVKQSADLHSPVGVLHFDYYKNEEDVKNYLLANEPQIQCVVGKGRIPFGYSQEPVITDFADNVDTREFLVSL